MRRRQTAIATLQLLAVVTGSGTPSAGSRSTGTAAARLGRFGRLESARVGGQPGRLVSAVVDDRQFGVSHVSSSAGPRRPRAAARRRCRADRGSRAGAARGRSCARSTTRAARSRRPSSGPCTSPNRVEVVWVTVPPAASDRPGARPGHRSASSSTPRAATGRWRCRLRARPRRRRPGAAPVPGLGAVGVVEQHQPAGGQLFAVGGEDVGRERVAPRREPLRRPDRLDPDLGAGRGGEQAGDRLANGSGCRVGALSAVGVAERTDGARVAARRVRASRDVARGDCARPDQHRVDDTSLRARRPVGAVGHRPTLSSSVATTMNCPQPQTGIVSRAVPSSPRYARARSRQFGPGARGRRRSTSAAVGRAARAGAVRKIGGDDHSCQVRPIDAPPARTRCCSAPPAASRAAHPPVWFMRQAGRSLPEYRALRADRDMLEACRTPDLITEITLQPVRRHGVDAAILFSDIMVPLVALGRRHRHRGRRRAGRRQADPDDVRPRPAAPARAGRRRLRQPPRSAQLVAELGATPLIGFAGAPFTLASYLIEGGPSREHAKTKALMHAEPAAVARAARPAGRHRRRLPAGSDRGRRRADPAVRLVGRVRCRSPTTSSSSLPHSRAVLESLADAGVPRIHFGVGTGRAAAAMRAAGADVVGVDWRMPLDEAARRLGPGAVVQGNLDPALLLAPWSVIEPEVRRVVAAGPGGGRAHLQPRPRRAARHRPRCADPGRRAGAFPR